MTVLGPSANLLSEVLQVQFQANSVTYMLASKQQSGRGGGGGGGEKMHMCKAKHFHASNKSTFSTVSMSVFTTILPHAGVCVLGGGGGGS